MSPADFWNDLFNNMVSFYTGLVNNVLIPIFTTCTQNVFVLLIIGIFFTGVIISVFRSILNG